MAISEVGLALIKKYEGFRSKPYLCPAGVPTQGYGRTAGITMKSPPVTEEEATSWLIEDCGYAEDIIRTYVKPQLNQNQLDALISFVYNIGPGRGGYKDGFVWRKDGKTSTILRLINEEEFFRASHEFPKWVHGGGKVLPGLVARREEERELFSKKPEPKEGTS